MKNETITIDRDEADRIAETYFSQICGFNRNKEKYQKMLNAGLAVRDKISDMINMRVVMSSFDKEAIHGKAVFLNGITFECNALEQINSSCIHQIYAYILTAGAIELKDASVMDMFYADTWGTAYVDAGRDLLRRIIKERLYTNRLESEKGTEERLFVSDSFGPGFYGMDITEVKHFFGVLDGEKAGVKVTDSGLMLPVKSCTGFYIVVNDAAQLPGADCKSCCSNLQGCKFCRVKTGERLS